MDAKTLKKEYGNTNKHIQALQIDLIDKLNKVGIEYIDLYQYINDLNALQVRKSKIQYLISINTIKGL